MPLWPGLEPPDAPSPAPPGPTTPTDPPPRGAATQEQPGSRGGSQPGTAQPPGQDDDEWIRPPGMEPAPHPTPALYRSTPPGGLPAVGDAGAGTGRPRGTAVNA